MLLIIRWRWWHIVNELKVACSLRYSSLHGSQYDPPVARNPFNTGGDGKPDFVVMAASLENRF